MNEATKALVKAALDKGEVAAQKWLREIAPQIERIVFDKLNRRLEETVAKFMGFRTSFGEWEIDFTNGRNSDSEVGEWLRKKVGASTNTWLEQQAGSLPVLSKSAIAALHREYLRTLGDEIARLLRDQAIADAQKAVDQILEIKNG